MPEISSTIVHPAVKNVKITLTIIEIKAITTEIRITSKTVMTHKSHQVVVGISHPTHKILVVIMVNSLKSKSINPRNVKHQVDLSITPANMVLDISNNSNMESRPVINEIISNSKVTSQTIGAVMDKINKIGEVETVILNLPTTTKTRLILRFCLL